MKTSVSERRDSGVMAAAWGQNELGIKSQARQLLAVFFFRGRRGGSLRAWPALRGS